MHSHGCVHCDHAAKPRTNPVFFDSIGSGLCGQQKPKKSSTHNCKFFVCWFLGPFIFSFCSVSSFWISVQELHPIDRVGKQQKCAASTNEHTFATMRRMKVAAITGRKLVLKHGAITHRDWQQCAHIVSLLSIAPEGLIPKAKCFCATTAIPGQLPWSFKNKNTK